MAVTEQAIQTLEIVKDRILRRCVESDGVASGAAAESGTLTQ